VPVLPNRFCRPDYFDGRAVWETTPASSFFLICELSDKYNIMIDGPVIFRLKPVLCGISASQGTSDALRADRPAKA
jgi:hypothetical protein